MQLDNITRDGKLSQSAEVVTQMPLQDSTSIEGRSGKLQQFPWGHLAATVLLVVFIAFGLTQIVEASIAPAKVDRQQSFAWKAVTSFTKPDRLADAYTPLPPNRNFYELGTSGQRVLVRTEFEYRSDMVAGEDSRMAIFITRARDRALLYVNGEAILTEPLDNIQYGPSYLAPRLYIIPPAVLKNGTNYLDIGLYGHKLPARLHDVYIAPLAALNPAYRARHLFVVDVNLMMIGMGFFVALFAFAIGSQSQKNRGEYLIVGLIMLLWVGWNIYYLMPMKDWPYQWQGVFFNVTAYGIIGAAAAFVNVWAGGAKRYNYLYIGLVVLYVVSSFCVDSLAPEYNRYMYLYFGIWLIFFFFGSVMLHVIRLIRSQYTTALVAASVFVLTMGVIDTMGGMQEIPGGVDTQSSWSISTSIPYTPISSIVLAFGIIYVLIRRTILYLQAEANQSVVLAEKLHEKETELEATYAKTRQQEKNHAIASERQRIMQDMHDGIGSQLLQLQLRVQSENMEAADVTAELQNSLNDLRLIVDSIETQSDDITFALGAFRSRIQPAMSAAGIELEWDMNIDDKVATFGPEAVLQIYRIMQEVVANVQRHSNATRLSIFMVTEAGVAEKNKAAPEWDKQLKIIITDNGDGLGFDANIERPGFSIGRGLENMRRRARMLNANIEFNSTDAPLAESGLQVIIAIPIPGSNVKNSMDESSTTI